MFEISELNCEGHDMELNSIETANFDAMIAEEAVINWLIGLETDDLGYELADQGPAENSDCQSGHQSNH